MRTRDLLRLSWRAVGRNRQRSALTMLGILIGISSVILLTSIGEGTRMYVISEFTQFGTNLVGVTPGRVETTGILGSMAGTIHPLTLEEAELLSRVQGVEEVVPVVVGTAPVEFQGRERHVFVYGVNQAGPSAWKMQVRVGRFLPGGDVRSAPPLAVLGPKLKRELFQDQNALGRHVRIAGQRFLVIGVMASKGQFLGFDIDDGVYIPVSLAMRLFNRDELNEIDLLISHLSVVDTVVERIRQVLIERHHGEEDFTITTQTGMLESLGRVLRIVALAVIGIGAISLLVGSIGILTIMWISVNERTSEIGLAKAIGATPQQILKLFLAESAILSTVGGILGIGIGLGLARLLNAVVPALPMHVPMVYVLLALTVSLVVGLLSGILPALRAAGMDPAQALGAE